MPDSVLVTSVPTPVVLPTSLACFIALQTGSSGFDVPRLPVLVVVTAAGLAMVYMGARQLRHPEWTAVESARHHARREGRDVEAAEPTAAAVERARKGGFVLLGLGLLFLLLAATQVL